jgi:hypothetical protein
MARANQDFYLNCSELKVLKLTSRVIRILKIHGCNAEYFKVSGHIKRLLHQHFISKSRHIPIKIQAYLSTVELMLSRYKWMSDFAKYTEIKHAK